MQHSWRHEQMIILERFCRNCALEIPPPGRDQRQETGAKASLAGDQNYSFLKTSQHIKKPLLFISSNTRFSFRLKQLKSKISSLIRHDDLFSFSAVVRKCFPSTQNFQSSFIQQSVVPAWEVQKTRDETQIHRLQIFFFFFFVLFFFQSAPLLSQLSVCTARGSNGSCLYKTEGAQISRRENWVSLEPQSKANPSMM